MKKTGLLTCLSLLFTIEIIAQQSTTVSVVSPMSTISNSGNFTQKIASDFPRTFSITPNKAFYTMTAYSPVLSSILDDSFFISEHVLIKSFGTNPIFNTNQFQIIFSPVEEEELNKFQFRLTENKKVVTPWKHLDAQDFDVKYGWGRFLLGSYHITPTTFLIADMKRDSDNAIIATMEMAIVCCWKMG